MSNYLNKQFVNTTDGFKSWSKTFKHLFDSDIVKTSYSKNGNYYLELNKVQSMDRSFKTYYLGISLREYNFEDKDFHLVHEYGDNATKHKEILTLFENRIRKFCINNELMRDYPKELLED